MLFGTSLLFRFFYFLTSFSPVFLILGINAGNIIIEKVRIENWKILVFIVLFNIIIGGFLKHSLRKKKILAQLKINFDKRQVEQCIDGFNSVKINSGFVNFILSMLFPLVTTTIFKQQNVIQTLVFVLIIFIIFSSSNEVFPNVVLLLWGVNLLTTKDGFNILYFRNQQQYMSGVKTLYKVGNTGNFSKTYILDTTGEG